MVHSDDLMLEGPQDHAPEDEDEETAIPVLDSISDADSRRAWNFLEFGLGINLAKVDGRYARAKGAFNAVLLSAAHEIRLRKVGINGGPQSLLRQIRRVPISFMYYKPNF